jgi:acyl-CoA reductase-like NAD-dependent aldehyde dehydrogenase
MGQGGRNGAHQAQLILALGLAQDLEYIAIAQAEGAKLVAGGEPIARNADGAPGFYLRPALFSETTKDMRIKREEVFGPVGERDPREGL